MHGGMGRTSTAHARKSICLSAPSANERRDPSSLAACSRMCSCMHVCVVMIIIIYVGHGLVVSGWQVRRGGTPRLRSHQPTQQRRSPAGGRLAAFTKKAALCQHCTALHEAQGPLARPLDSHASHCKREKACCPLHSSTLQAHMAARWHNTASSATGFAQPHLPAATPSEQAGAPARGRSTWRAPSRQASQPASAYFFLAPFSCTAFSRTMLMEKVALTSGCSRTLASYTPTDLISGTLNS